MSQGDLFGARSEPPPEPVRALYDVDCTPSPVAAQGVIAVTQGVLRPACTEPGQEHAGDAPRVLDVCAGSGSWARAARLLFPRATITALEARADEQPYLQRWADEVVIGDVAAIVVQALRVRLRDAQGPEADRLRALLVMLLVEPEPAGEASPLGTYDLIIGNPPFSLHDTRVPVRKGHSDLRGGWVPEQPGKSRLRAFEVLVVALRELLAPRGRLALYVPAAWWHRGGDVAALAREHQPFLQRNVPLPVSHRGAGQQAATDAYAIYAWSHPSVPAFHGWHACDLPILAAGDRRWSVVPGTEDA